MKVTELEDARERDVFVNVVDDGSALKIANVENLALEIDGAPSEPSLGVIEIAVDRTRVDDWRVFGEARAQVEIIDVEHDLNVGMFEHPLEQTRVA